MKRIDRARIVRDDLLGRANCWEATCLGDTDVASLEWRGVNALLYTRTGLARAVDYAGIPEILSAKTARLGAPYTLDVWVRGLRVLSMVWNARDEIKVVRMTRGDWESDYFHLPAPSGGRGPTIH